MASLKAQPIGSVLDNVFSGEYIAQALFDIDGSNDILLYVCANIN